MMTDEEKWFFDLNGFVVLRNAIPGADVERMVERALKWHKLPDAQLPRPVETYGGEAKGNVPGKMRALCHVEYADEVFSRTAMNREIMRCVLYLTDNSPQMLMSAVQIYPKGSGDLGLHNGQVGAIRNPANDYQVGDGRVFATFLNAAIMLVDHPAGMGFCCVPGSHKAYFRHPPTFNTRSGFPIYCPPAKAGDVILFTENLTHGALSWEHDAYPRVAMFFRYSTSYATWSVGWNVKPDYRHLVSDDLAELMAPMPFQGRKKVVDKVLKELAPTT
ncbi:MAG: phytanoyl-CoA dioxygenase family protein [Planctomycetes bacterium]|nr:phytanoyl-CoA dioxygenase family protein [Planctomycetota bacterium]